MTTKIKRTIADTVDQLKEQWELLKARFEVFMSIFSVCMLLTLVLASIGFGIVSN